MTDEVYSNELQFLTVTKVAQCFRLSKALVYGLVESRRLLASRLGEGRGAIRNSRNS